jgi:monoamine oxidase
MPRTPLAQFLSRLAGDHADARRRGVDVARIVAERRASRPTRREFLSGAAVAAAGVALAGPLRGVALAAGGPKPQPRVAIVGAGVAGLVAALTLADEKTSCTLYEATGRVGGRMDSDRTSWAAGQVSERGGELIDTGHKLIRDLARRFKLPLDDLRADEPVGSTRTFFFDDAYYSEDEAVADFRAVYDALSTDLKAAGYPTRYDSFTSAGQALDAMSVRAWIESRVPGGLASKMGRLLDVAYEIEYGRPTSEQSALNIVYLLAYQPKPLEFAEFGVSDERFHVRGGNDRIPAAIADALPDGTIVTGHALTRVVQTGDGGFALTFDTAHGAVEVAADVVVLAIPFSVLRTVDLSGAGFSQRKHKAIAELGYGTNAKLNVQFASRPWRHSGPYGISNGTSYADTGYQSTWEVSRAQPGAPGIVVDYVGGGVGTALSQNGPADVPGAAATFLSQIEPVWPGVSATWNGRATLSAPVNDPYRRGSYACYLVGQIVAFGGVEGEAEGRCLFAGEHTSQDFQGFMEGAATEGRRAGRDVLRVLDDLRAKK